MSQYQCLRKTRVYIASPYSKGNASINIRNSIEAAERLIALGFVPYCPLLTHLWQLISPHDLDFWYVYDNEWLRACDALIRLPGESKGADDEVSLAQSCDIPVFHSFDDLINGIGTQSSDPESQETQDMLEHLINPTPRAGRFAL